MVKSTKDLKKTKTNPRLITEGALEKLNENLTRFGDLGGVIYNVQLKELVSGNQRTSLFNLKSKNKIEYTETLKTPTEDGTTAYGYILIDNQKFSYREVEWDEEKHKAAVLLANTHAGKFDFSMLESEFANIDFEGLGMDDLKMSLDRFVLGDLEDVDSSEGDNTEYGNNENGETSKNRKLSDIFIVPPFSVLDTRQAYWQDRKRYWLSLGIKSEIGRGGA